MHGQKKQKQVRMLREKQQREQVIHGQILVLQDLMTVPMQQEVVVQSGIHGEMHPLMKIQ